MDSLKSKADSVRAAVGSISTCTSTTASILTELLLLKAESPTTTSVKPTKSTKASAAPNTRAPASKPKAKKLTFEEQPHEEAQLSAKQRSILATEVINATLKSLSDALKAPLPSHIRRQTSKDLVKSAARTALRRSNSFPQSPLQPRSLNRVASSPNISNRCNRSSSTSSTSNSGYRGTAECARIAFACLRALQTAKTPGVDLPPLQLENGMSVLIGKLISLGLGDLATKELRILKRRLEVEESGKKRLVQKAAAATTTSNLADLLNFGKAAFTGAQLGLVITTQLQVLRLLTTANKPKFTESALPVLRAEHPSSPTRLLLEATKDSKNSKQTDKLVRQMQSLSEVLLSLCPSISTSEDSLALEERLSISPDTAVQLQTIALHNRFLWWGIAAHEGDLSKEIFDPFFRCLTAFARRSHGGARRVYETAFNAWQDLNTLVLECSDTKPRALNTVLGGTWRLLGSMAKEAGNIEAAIGFASQARLLLEPAVDSDAKRAAAVARLVSLRLQRAKRESVDEELLLSLLENLEMPFKGESSEVDELMTEISQARKSAINLLAQHRPSSEAQATEKLTDGIRQMCESLVFLCPRLSLRYIGSAPDIKSATKDIVRYEQRRQFITRSAVHAVDSALFLVKILLGEGRYTWDLVDSKLQDCLMLLDRLNLDSRESSQDSLPGASYYVRISNLFYSQYLTMKQIPENTKDTFRALRRSIDCIKSRPAQEKKAAQLTTKLERLAEVYKASARYDDLFQTLVNIRDEIAADGVLAAVAERAASVSTKLAWNDGRESSILGRTVQSLVKVQLKYITSAGQVSLVNESWSEEEQGVVLEQQLDMLYCQANTLKMITSLQNRVIEDLLQIYGPEQYPLRRVRVLLHLALADNETLSESLLKSLKELNDTDLEHLDVMGTRDGGLADYLAHFKSLATTTMELQGPQPNVQAMKNGLSAWSFIRNSCETIEALCKRVDDLPGLITHLHTISDWLQIKGVDDTRLAVLRLIADINELQAQTTNPDDPILSLSNLGLQWLQLGYSGKAGLCLDKANTYNHQDGVSSYATLYLHISYCQYLLVIGSMDKFEEHLAQAQALYVREKDNISRLDHGSGVECRTKLSLLMSNAYQLYSKISIERGVTQVALTHAKQSVRLLRRAWATIEQQARRASATPERASSSDADKLASDFSQMTLLNVSRTSETLSPATYDPNFWSIVTPLFCSLNYLSELFAHNGMFPETIYYAEQAHKLAGQVHSDGLLALSETILGNAWLRGGILGTGSEYLMKAKQLCASSTKSRIAATLAYHQGKMLGILGDIDAELCAYNQSDEILDFLTKPSQIESLDKFVEPADELEEKLSKMTLEKKKSTASRKATRAKTSAKGKTSTRINATVVGTVPSVSTECRQLLSLRATLLREKSRLLTSSQSSEEAFGLLQEAALATNSQHEVVDQDLALAKLLLLQSMEQMVADPVYSVLQDSTISFPSVVTISKGHGERLSVTKVSPPRKGQGAKDRTRSKSPVSDSFFDKLRQAQEYLTEAHSTALLSAPISVVHHTSSLLNSVSILLSAAGQVKGKSLAQPGLASSSIEVTRNLALRRERKAIQAESLSQTNLDETVWPQLSSQHRRSSLGFPGDISRFQKDFVDIIPKPWTVISVSISDSRQELSITKLQAGHSPFVLRLPLGRHNSMDADEEVFGFEQGRSELQEIVDRANESAHSSKGRDSREAKLQWWEERESLDARLRDLLENVEKVWLGGFTGIFSQHPRRPDLLSRFQKSFQNILDKHLPSRQKTKKRTVAPRINLDSRILDLFIGLGDSPDQDADFSEPLTDLLYFVVDVLQFHGELNAYAEIDFDAIVMETTDALRSYYEAVNSSGQEDEGRHTILILDKALHCFPWESLPCMDGLAVSRLPSLSCLRKRIMTQRDAPVEGKPEGHYIRRENGTYILNPGGDLKTTQATFQQKLQNLKGWDGIDSREPTEEEFKSTLRDKDLLLYFGHGSGAQYIRAREIKRLEKCAVAVLMGCSSGALVETGEFEPHGPPINYMHAGCHALVATLWDVTDKDIDKFAKTTFENWGLWEAETMGHRKWKKRVEKPKDKEGMSLVEAVAKSRSACHLRYLNAASVCVYGIPVYLE